MPNIFKHFLGQSISSYAFPDVDDIQMDDPPPQEEAPEVEEDTEARTISDDEEEDAGQPEETDSSGAGEGAAAMFAYARVQAEEIMAQARREGEALLEEYRQRAQQEAQEARAAAQDEGFRQGYSDGMAKAQVESQAALQQLQQQQADQVSAFLEKASQAREDLLDQTREELCDLSIAVAEKVIHISLKSSREVILRMVQMATERLRRREWVRIYVGGCEARELSQITPALTASLAGLSDHIQIIPMADDESGTCIIEMPDEIIDASVSTQLNNLKDILRGG